MKRAMIVVALMLSAVCALSAEPIQSKEHTFRVKYKDGVTEQYKVRWVAVRDIEVHEDGHPAIPLQGWFTDTRQCHWTVTGQVQRHVFLVSRNGREFEDGNRYQAFHSNFVNKGSDFVLLGLRPENCNDAANRRNSDYENVRVTLLRDFETIVKADFDRIVADFNKDGDVTIQQ